MVDEFGVRFYMETGVALLTNQAERLRNRFGDVYLALMHYDAGMYGVSRLTPAELIDVMCEREPLAMPLEFPRTNSQGFLMDVA